MFGIADIIVGIWFLPVVLFIVIPLAMLCCWTAFKLFRVVTRNQPASERRERLEGVSVGYSAS